MRDGQMSIPSRVALLIIVVIALAWPAAPTPTVGYSDAAAPTVEQPADASSMPAAGGENRRLVLLIGLDDVEGSHRADALVLVAVTMQPPRIDLISIPRDLRVELSQRGWNKINAAYAYGGTALTVQAVEEFLDLAIDHSIVVSYPAFKRVVDRMGGITYTVERRMRYVDRAQGLEINLQPGRQHLDGERALHYVRFRADGRGDLGRITRAQQLLRAAFDQWRAPGTIARLPLILPEVLDVIQTDISISHAVRMADVLRTVTPDGIRAVTIPGAPAILGGVSYFVADQSEARQAVTAFLHDPTALGTQQHPQR